MKKILLTLIVIAGLTACTKEQATEPKPEQQTVFVRIESVSNAGAATYSDVVMIKLK